MISDDDFKSFQKFFSNYLKTLKISDKSLDKLKMKVNHTGNVVKIGTELASKLNLDINLAKTICLFHDIGRFPQIEKYDTLKDSESEDHAELGIKVLEESKILDSFDEKDLIITSIRFHNKIVYDIPKFNDPLKTYINFIRDADKIDICRVVLEYNIHGNLSSEYNQNCVDDFLKGLQVKRSDLKSNLDQLIMELSWIFDINFKESMNILKEQGNLAKGADLLPPSLIKIKEKVYSSLGIITISE